INHPAVIIGVHQNAYAEVNLSYLKAHNIDLVRRSSGGGAVYQDYGNIIFENIVVNDPTAKVDNYAAIGAPILSALQDLGVNAQLSGRNDLVIEGKKFCGMTMVKVGDSYAAGGTIMFDLDNQAARQVLTPNQEKLQSKGVKSVDKRITNIKPYLPAQYQHWTGEDFKNYLLCHMFGVKNLAEIETYSLTAADWQNIDNNLKTKYKTDEWNFGKNPGYHEYVSHHFDIGT
ncbi:lipoate--protein ligase family protein, partial [Lactobacillus sp. XV13L]|nr:lipoate--protein ligase family protein [Lactobacillus sp. XV13L]